MSAPINLNKFSGIFPRVTDTDLPSNAALISQNIDFGYNELRSFKGSFKLRELAIAARSVFSDDGLRFYAWGEDVDVAVSPLQSGTANDRLYYTTDSDFRVTLLSLATTGGSTPGTSYRVGVPRPTVAPYITVQHPATPVAPTAEVDLQPADTYAVRLAAAQQAADDALDAKVTTATETRVYTYTYANIYNEEGPPSPGASIEVKSVTVDDVTEYSKVMVTVTFDGNGEYVPITGARLYRTAGSASADYFYALTVSTGAGEVQDAILPAALNEMLSSDYAYPPNPMLKGLFNIGNGILAAWMGKEIWFSDAYRPWAWNPANVVTVRNTIVGAAKHGTGALITTVGEPSIVSGVSPDAMTEIPLEIPQAGVSKWALLSVAGSALYACHDGIVAVDGGSPSFTLSDRFFTREVWRARYGAGLSSMQFASYDGRLIVFSKTGQFVPFLINLSQGAGEMTELPDLVASTALVLTTSDQMYTVNGTGLYQFAGGSDLPLHWQSGDIVLPAPAVLAAAQVECVGNFTVKFYQAGVLGYTMQLTTGQTLFRLPSEAIPGHAGLPPSDRWQFDITGTGRFKWLKAASSIRGLKEA